MRNPYTQIQSIINYGDRFSFDNIVTHVVECIKQQYNNLHEYGDIIHYMKYEDLCNFPSDEMRKLCEFMPELGHIDIPESIGVKKRVGPITPISLTTDPAIEDIKIRAYDELKKCETELNFLGYSL